MSNIYEGHRHGTGTSVTKNGRKLSPAASLKVFNHSPAGFEWGYGGSGPAQLALAILLEEGLTPDQAVDFHQAFKWYFVATLKRDAWLLDGAKIQEWLAGERADRLEIAE